jgi:hypothetical protein
MTEEEPHTKRREPIFQPILAFGPALLVVNDPRGGAGPRSGSGDGADVGGRDVLPTPGGSRVSNPGPTPGTA